jgi:hypothetical protein
MTVRRSKLKEETERVEEYLSVLLDMLHPAGTALDRSVQMVALLELGFDRALDIHGDDYALGYIQQLFAETVKKRRDLFQYFTDTLEKHRDSAMTAPEPSEMRIVLGVTWYRRKDWPRLMQLIPDREIMQDNFAEWLCEAELMEQDIKATGTTTRRIILDPDELTAWCEARGRQPDAKGRAEYVTEKTRQHEAAQ